MKKIYIAPVQIEMNANLVQMIAESPYGMDGEDGQGNKTGWGGGYENDPQDPDKDDIIWADTKRRGWDVFGE